MASSDPSPAVAGLARPGVVPGNAGVRTRVFARPRFWLLLITALGILLRCLFLGSKSFWMDEGFSVYMAQADYASFFRYVRGGEINMIAYYGLLRLWVHLGIGESFIRLLSVIASAATIPLLYLIGKRLFTARVGLLAAALLAVHPSHIAYSQEARSYALAVFLVCLATLLLLRCLSNGGAGDYALYAAAVVLSIYSLVLTALIPLAQAPAAVRRLPGRHRLRLALVAGVGIVLLVPVIFVGWTRGAAIASWMPPLSRPMLLRVWRFLTLQKFGFLYGLVWLGALGAALRRSRRAQLGWPTALVACWLVLPVAILIAISLFKPLLVPRVVLMCVPAAALLAAQGVDSLPLPANWIAFTLVMVASLGSVRSYYRTPKPDWRGVTALVMAESQPGDAVVVTPAYAQFTVDYYRQLRGLPASRLPEAAPSGQIAGSPQPARRLWLGVYGGQGYNPAAQEALQSVLVASRNRYCVAASSQFKYVELFLLPTCSRAADSRR